MQISAEFPFESKFADVLGSRMHYIEQGEGSDFLFLHGNPTWSYLWRNVIPPVAEHARCTAFDLIGFGKSDKPPIGYTFQEHYQYVDGLIEALDLKDIVLVGHDWGGALAFHYAANHRNTVRGMAFMETFPFTIKWDEFPKDMKTGFRLFRTPVIGKFMIMVLNIFVNKVLPGAIHRELSSEIHDNYKKPFPTIGSRYPVYVWPNELPIEDLQNRTYRTIEKLGDACLEFEFPALLVTSQPGGIMNPARVEWCRNHLRDLTITDIGPGIHYLQEDNPQGIAAAIIDWAEKKHLFQP